MATTRLTTRNLNSENVGVHGQKKAVQKPVTRAALKNISNKVERVVQNVPLKLAKEPVQVLKDEPIEPVKPPTPVEEDEVPNYMDVSTSKEFPLKHADVTDIDKDDHDNPQLVSAYVNEIYTYMRDLETQYSIRPNFLDGREVTGRMRSILLDWLVQVHQRFHLLQETLYLTVAILDRFLQCTDVTKSKLQLVGVTSMLVASKYEEMYAPEIGDFEYITDNAYSKAEIRKMEGLILKSLEFNLGRPLPLHFLRRNSKAAEVDATRHTIAKYLIELSIVEYDMAHINPSEIAAAALYLAMKLWDESHWSETVEHYSKYSEEELLPIVRKMAGLAIKAPSAKLSAIFTKYKSSKYLRISTLAELNSPYVHELAKGAL